MYILICIYVTSQGFNVCLKQVILADAFSFLNSAENFEYCLKVSQINKLEHILNVNNRGS